MGKQKKIVQVIQPYHLVHHNTVDNGLPNFNKTSNSHNATLNFTDSNVSHQADSSFASVNSLHLNYITGAQQIAQSASTPGHDVLYSTEHFSSKIPLQLLQQSDSVSALGNDLTSTVSEDQLVVENAGSFGQRLQIQGDDASVYSTTTATTPTSSPVHGAAIISSATTRGGRYFQGRARQKNSKPYLPDTIPGLGAYSSTTYSPLDNSVTANSIESVSNGNSGHSRENNGIFGSHGLIEAYSTSSNVPSTIPNPFLINYSSQGVLSSSSKDTSLPSAEKKEYGFSKPIVVPDVPNERPFQYSTTFACEDDVAFSSTPDPLASFKDTFGEGFGGAWSSHILNPIQAGVSLLNAGEAHLIDSTVSRDETPPAPVNEEVEDTPQSDQAVQQLNTVATQASNYVGINPAFGDQESTPQPPQQQQQQVQQQSQAQEVEVQKSIELYPSSLNYATHYTEQPASAQVPYIDQQQQTQLQEGQQQQLQIQQYLLANADLNSKQGGSRTRGESLTKVYDISDNYSKDLVAEQPVYVVPPATYVVEDTSVLKNNLLQEKVQLYQTDASENDNSLKSEQQQGLRTEVESSVNQQSYQPFDSTGGSYISEVAHEQQQKIVLQPEVNVATILEKTVHVPHAYPVEKIIEKKVPYPVEKIIEKKIPVPHPYPVPVPVQVPVPQPFPVHIEKIVEKKVPIPLHIPVPHPIPVEKPIHIPVTIEKIVERKIPYPVEVTKYVEKPLTVHAPYGVKYGVSYQQIMKPENHGLYSFHANSLAPLYAFPLSNNLYSSSGSSSNIAGNSIITKAAPTNNDINSNHLNHSQLFQGYFYEKPSIPFIEGKEKLESKQFLNTQVGTKKLSYNSYALPSYPLSNALLHRRHTVATSVHRPSKSEPRDDYFGPVPPLLQLQRQSYGFQSKTSSFAAAYPSLADRTQATRKSRNYEPARAHEPARYPQKGNFRQSKIEYGFKPPMVPSVQYDEETASKVES